MFNLYIGANNATGKLERSKIRTIAAKAFEGFTLINATGYWQGKAEKSIILQIETMDRAKVEQLAGILKAKLEQDAIGLQELPHLEFI